MGVFAGRLGIALVGNFGVYALAIWVVRGVYFVSSIPGQQEEFWTLGIVSALLNTFVAPLLMLVKIPKLIFVQLILLVGMNGMLLNYFSNQMGSAIRIDTLGWLVGYAVIVGMISLLMGALARPG